MSRVGSVQPGGGLGLELEAIAAVCHWWMRFDGG